VLIRGRDVVLGTHRQVNGCEHRSGTHREQLCSGSWVCSAGGPAGPVCTGWDHGVPGRPCRRSWARRLVDDGAPVTAVAVIEARQSAAVPPVGDRVWYRRVGGGPRTALLILHGGPGAGHDCLEPLDALADERPVIFTTSSAAGAAISPTTRPAGTSSGSFAKLTSCGRPSA
jgi:hypothetical protein